MVVELGIKTLWLVVRMHDIMHINYVVGTQDIVVAIIFIIAVATMFRIKPIQSE